MVAMYDIKGPEIGPHEVPNTTRESLADNYMYGDSFLFGIGRIAMDELSSGWIYVYIKNWAKRIERIVQGGRGG